jgi:polysaccharide pyruvyl transferase WcaK-like protein
MTGRPTFVAPITVNPFSANVGRVLHWGLRGASLFARDAQTLTRFRDAGLEGVLVPDIAFRAPTLLRQAKLTADAGPRTGTPTIGWAPRGYRRDHQAWGDPAAAEQLTFTAVRRILAASTDRLRFIPHVRAGAADDDLDAVNRLLAQLTPAERQRVEVAATPETLEDAVRQYTEVDVLITSRMHAAIFALAVGTPAIAVAYEPKVAGVMADVGLADRVVPADTRLSADALIDLVARLRTPVERARTREAYARVQGRFAEFDDALRPAAGRSS